MTTYGNFSFIEKNYALCRKDLDLITNGNFKCNFLKQVSDMQFIKINGIKRLWKNEKSFDGNSIIGDVFNGLVRHGLPFAYFISGHEEELGIYIGILKVFSDILKSSFESVFPGIDLTISTENPLQKNKNEFGGLFTGVPTSKIESEKDFFQIEKICRGMQGKNFSYLVLASGISNIAVSFGHEKILEEMANVFSVINHTVSGGVQGNISIQKQDFHSKDYFDNLKFLEENLKNGTIRGMWRVNGYYASDSQLGAKMLGSIIKSTFSGEKSHPEPFRVIDCNLIHNIFSDICFINDPFENAEHHPLGSWLRPELSAPINLFNLRFQTILNSDQLATLCQLPKQEFPGYYIDDYVEFDVANRNVFNIREPTVIGEIVSATNRNCSSSKNVYTIEKNDLTRHVLIVGVTGGGKTNTAKTILNTLWVKNEVTNRVPFMVIESAKREYWELRNLKGFEDLLVFTLGSESSDISVKYRINPFETYSHISLQTHIDYLLSTFKAAFELYPPMPYILEQAVYEVYDDRGWDIVENKNRYGLTEYPTLSDLYNKIEVIVESLGYHQEIQSNVKAALKARIYSLMIGGKGAMLNISKSFPIEELLNRPVIMELEDLGDDETKSFVIGILLVQLFEYRKSQMKKGSKALSHILLVEEAHRLLKNVSNFGEAGSVRARSVDFFCNMLAEIRTSGQGIIISDQIPTKLAPDTMKNTNLKIVHRTVAFEDRDTIGKAMNMDQAQIDYLSSLKRGFAAVYSEGDSRPKCVKLPLIDSYYDKDREEVILEVQKKVCDISYGYNKKITYHVGCSFCENRCAHYDRISFYIDQKIDTEKVIEKWAENRYSPKALAGFLNASILRDLQMENVFVCICILGYILTKDRKLNEGQRQKILAEYLRYTCQSNN